MKKPDLEGATLTLASLARVVESLPLASSTPEEETVVDEEQSGVDRAWNSVKDAMSGLVKVTPPDQAKLALVSPDAAYFLRSNIALQLQSAWRASDIRASTGRYQRPARNVFRLQ